MEDNKPKVLIEHKPRSGSAPTLGFTNPSHEDSTPRAILPALDDKDDSMNINFTSPNDYNNSFQPIPFEKPTSFNSIFNMENGVNEEMLYTQIENFVVSILYSFKNYRISTNVFNDNIIKTFINLYRDNINSKCHHIFDNVLRKYNIKSYNPIPIQVNHFNGINSIPINTWKREPELWDNNTKPSNLWDTKYTECKTNINNVPPTRIDSPLKNEFINPSLKNNFNKNSNTLNNSDNLDNSDSRLYNHNPPPLNNMFSSNPDPLSDSNYLPNNIPYETKYNFSLYNQ